MDWPTIRVLTKNLRELLAEMDAGTHVKAEKVEGVAWDSTGSVKERWRVGILAIGSSLSAELGMKNDESPIHPSWQSFSGPMSDNFKHNPYVRTAVAVVEVAEKMLKDYDAEMTKAMSANR